MVSIPNKKMIVSPLRYPGGKGTLYPFFVELLKRNELNNIQYYEPYAGGASVALSLLSLNLASEVILNDADYHIYCFWYSLLNENERFIDKIQSTKVSIKTWKKIKGVYKEPQKYSVFEVGFSTFYLNRCNRSGIIAGAGPIGGYKQDGKWRLDARFNKKNLIARIADIGKLKERISIKNMDAIDFLKKKLPHGRARENILVYIDPPYISAGKRLYLNYYLKADHKKLADYLLKQVKLKWVVTYDNATIIKKLYSPCQKWLFKIGYSLQSKLKGKELLIAPNFLFLPTENEFYCNRWSIIKKIVPIGG
jgi:DNA adenine methylase